MAVFNLFWGAIFIADTIGFGAFGGCLCLILFKEVDMRRSEYSSQNPLASS